MADEHKPSHRRSTRSLIVLFALATVAPLVLLVALPLSIATSSLSTQAKSRVADTSSVAADALGMQLDSIKSLTATYAKRTEIIDATEAGSGDSGSTSALRQELRELQQSSESIKATMVLDAAGKIVSLEPHATNAIGKDYSFRDYFSGAIGIESSYVSEAFASTATGNPTYVAVAQRVVDQSGKAVGVVIAAVDVKTVFQTYVDRFRVEHGVELAVYDQRRHLVAGKGDSSQLVVVNDDHVKNAIAGAAWSGTVRDGNNRVVRAYSPILGSGWVISASVPRDAAFAPEDELQSRVILLAAVLGSVVLMAVVLLARSINGRARAEHQLRSSEMRTRAILDTARQMFCEIDERGEVVDWNAEAEELLGWTREDMLGQSALDVLVPDGHRERVRKAFNSLLEADTSEEQAHKAVATLLRKNTEQPLTVEVSSWVTAFEGRKSINLFVNDISDRIRLQREQELVVKRQKALVEELQAADKAKSDFISTISHELRTPLTSITGYLEMLQDGLGGPLNENQQMMIDVVERNSHRLLSLIEDVLTLSRIESGSFKVERTLADMRNVVMAAVETLLPSIHNNGLTLDVDVASNIGTVVGDVDQLERVVLNLMNNAVKFTPEGGRLSVVAYRQDSTVTISVSDTGVGIPVEEQPRLFSRFFRASTAQNHAVQGTGLGLTIVKSIVERHGGTVSLQSAAGVGTTVTVELPIDVTQLESTSA